MDIHTRMHTLNTKINLQYTTEKEITESPPQFIYFHRVLDMNLG